MKRTIVILLLITVQLFATDIKLKNGNIIRNVEITKETDTYLEYKLGNAKRRVPKVSIDEIIRSDVNYSMPASVGDELTPQQQKFVVGTYKPTYLLPVAALSFLVGYNSLADASDIGDVIDDISGPQIIDMPDGSTLTIPGVSTNDLEAQRDRKLIVGYISLLAGAAITFISFQEFNVYATPNKIELSYRF